MSTIRCFSTFLAVARHGSFAAAAEQVCLTQAAVSLQMRTLEQALGRPLFDRTRRSAVLNAHARSLVPLVEQLVATYDAIVASGSTQALTGVIRVGALVSTLMGAFSDALLAMKQAHPQLDVKLFVGLSSDFAVRVERGELDAAVTTQAPVALPDGLLWTRLYEEAMVLIMPRATDGSDEDDGQVGGDPREILARHPFIRFDRHTWTGLLVEDALRKLDARVDEIMELNSLETIAEMVRRGFGVSIVPRLANAAWNRDAALREVSLPAHITPRRVGLLERRHHTRTAFTEAVKRHFGVIARNP